MPKNSESIREDAEAVKAKRSYYLRPGKFIFR